jgi:hypothetical protein
LNALGGSEKLTCKKKDTEEEPTKFILRLASAIVALPVAKTCTFLPDTVWKFEVMSTALSALWQQERHIKAAYHVTSNDVTILQCR